MAVEFSGTIVVPTVSYGNIQPAFSVQGETFEEARNLWLQEARRLYRAVGKDFDLDDTVEAAPQGVKLRCVASGTEVFFDAVTHTYGPGEWLGGSTFAGQFKKPFPADSVAARMAAKHGVEASEIRRMWALKAEASTSLGTAIHAALQQYGEFLELSRTLKDGSDVSALHDNPMLRSPVLQFFEGRAGEQAWYEAFVADPVLRHCGQIDRLLRVGPKRVRVQDFKTNADIFKKVDVLPPFKGVVENTSLGLYWVQLSFYSAVLARHGWTVEGLDIFHWTGEKWDTYTHDVVDVTPGFK